MVPSASPAQSASPVGRAAHRRTALRRGRAVGHLLGLEHQVVRAGLDRHPDPVGPGGRERGQRGGAGQVHHMQPDAGTPGHGERRLDRGVLGLRRPRREEPGIGPPGRLGCGRQHAGVLGVHQQQPADRGQLGRGLLELFGRQRRELLDARVGQEALDTHHAGVEQWLEPAEVGRHRAAPEGDVHGALAGRGRPLHRQRLGVEGRRQAVQWHVHDRGDAAGRGGPGRGGEPLPLGATGLVDVHMGVHQPRQQHHVVAELDDLRRRVATHRPVQRSDPRDHAARDRHGHRLLTCSADSGAAISATGRGVGGQHCTGSVQHEVGLRRRGHAVPVRCSGRIGTRVRNWPLAARTAARTAGPEEMVGGSPTPRRP